MRVRKNIEDTTPRLFLAGSFVKFIVKAIFTKGKERNWFKENIYNCEGN